MDHDKIALVAGVVIAAAVGAYVVWGPSAGHRRKKKDVRGLTNLGYTCFLNTLLQALASCPLFLDWLMQQMKDNNGDVTSLIRTLHEVMLILNNKHATVDDNPYTPRCVINALLSHGWVISPGEQDAHELFHVLISTLEEESQRKTKVMSLLDVAKLFNDIQLEAKPAKMNGVNHVASLADHGDDTALKTEQDKTDTKEVKAISLEYQKNGKCLSSKFCTSVGKLDTYSKGDKTPDGIISTSPQRQPRGCISELLKNHLAASDTSIYPRKRSIIHSDGILSRISKTTCTRIGKLPESPFRGLLTSQLRCTACGYKSAVLYDKFDSLSLSLPPPSWVQLDLDLLIQNFVAQETVKDVTCESCTQEQSRLMGGDEPPVKTTFIKQLNFGKLPSCLCFHIQRTAWLQNGQASKRHDHVEFPEFLSMDKYTYTKIMNRQNSLKAFCTRNKKCPSQDRGDKKPLMQDVLTQMQKFSSSPNLPTSDCESSTNEFDNSVYRNLYRLKAVVVHKGDVVSGHFVTFRRGPLGSHTRHRVPDGKTKSLSPIHQSQRRWYHTSDSAVRDSSLSEVMKSAAYMLFYERCSPSGANE